MVYTLQIWLFYYLEVGAAHLDRCLVGFSLEVVAQAGGVVA